MYIVLLHKLMLLKECELLLKRVYDIGEVSLRNLTVCPVLISVPQQYELVISKKFTKNFSVESCT